MTGGANYRGRLAPSPTGFLHLGHAATFWQAQQRSLQQKGTLLLRIEDLDRDRVRPEFTEAIYQDLRWFGLDWQEGPDSGGPFAPYQQSGRLALYRQKFDQLLKTGLVYPCTCSRQEILGSLTAPHEGEEEPVYPGTCRPGAPQNKPSSGSGRKICWRFQVPDGAALDFTDQNLGPQSFTAGQHFGDFVIWRRDDLPSYQLAVTVDDAAMKITEVVRGEDLLLSTARQLLLYRAMGVQAPNFFHCPLVRDSGGRRLAKRDAALSLRALRQAGRKPADLRTSI